MNAVTVPPGDDVAHGLGALAGRLVPGASGIASLRRLSGGAVQETYAFEVVGPDGPRAMVLRRARKALRQDRSYGVSLAEEAAAIRLAGEGGVPVAEVVHVLEEADGLGEGFVSAFVEGETIPRRILREPAFAGARERFAADCGRVLARLHALPLERFPFLETISPATALARMDAQYRALDRPGPVFEAALRWLADHLPPMPPRAAVVHADFRMGNLIMRPEGIAAVIDWEGVHIGDPAADIAYLTARSWRFGQLAKPVGGVGTRKDLIEAYRAGGGSVPDGARLRFWDIAHTLWWGLVCAEMARQFTSRADYAVERGAVGRRRSEAEIDLVCLLERELRS
jgi:aminoglycoside phosphotransferase (APT) family kinase protein